MRTIAIYETTEEVRESLNTQALARDIVSAGKIFYKGGYIFINEVNEGIHVIDNTDPKSPKNIRFIEIPGNADLTGQGDYLYADSYIDLLVLDISDPKNVQLTNRLDGALADRTYWRSNNHYQRDAGLILTGYEEVEEIVELPCDKRDFLFGASMLNGDDIPVFSDPVASVSLESGAGVSGSLSRFIISNDHLYTVDNTTLRLFDLSEPTKPIKGDIVDLGRGIETLFTRGNTLFIGAVNGMHIYDNTTPSDPKLLSTYEHIESCDPVVVQGSYAYVTLRSGGSRCGGFTNQLEVVNIEDLRNPRHFKTYPMKNPHGLGIRGNCLFIAEGEFGLKYLDASDAANITQIDELTSPHSVDVIALDELLLVIGEGGFRQYEYNCEAREWSYLSSISVVRYK